MVPFLKMHGLGNDFVVFDARERSLSLTAAKAQILADRHFGIGCDTVVLIQPGTAAADARLVFYNADGGEVESCGNASRCIARLLMDERGLARVKLDTKGGLLVCEDAGKGLVRVDMGPPGLLWNEVPLAQAVDHTDKFELKVDGTSLLVGAVSMGNPHCVIFVDDALKAPVTSLGPRIETHPLFPNRVNVEFAQVMDQDHIRMRVWERGVGVTLACGTGACATAVAAARLGLANRKVEVTLDGGKLLLDWRESDGHVLMTGPAVTVFYGEVDLDAL
jgi:diaminopimelate epimerase